MTSPVNTSTGPSDVAPLLTPALPRIASSPVQTATEIRDTVLSDVASVLLNVDTTIAPEVSPAALQALHAAVEDPAVAVRIAHDLIQQHPQLAQTLPHDPVLAPLRTQMEALVTQMTHDARGAAEHILRVANDRVAAPTPAGQIPDITMRVNPMIILETARRLMAEGDYLNYRRAGGLAQRVLDSFAPAARRSAEIVWRRAPMLLRPGG